jgi:hypothetical protein
MPVGPQLNPRDAMLVNDLDLSVKDASFNTYYPYKLDYDNPSAAATNNSKNYVDNVEMVFLPQAEGGTYTITVTHDGMLENNEQAFSLIISGIDEYDIVPECTSELLTPEDGATDILLNEWISWEKAEYASSYDVYFGTDGNGIETPTNVYSGENFSGNGFSYLMDPAATYYLQVVPRNSFGPAENCEQIWSFTTMEAISQYPYLMDVSEVETPEIPQYWQSNDLSEARWESTSLSSHSQGHSMLCWNLGGVIETNYDNWLISPPFNMEVGEEYNISCYYKSFLSNHDETLKLFWGNSPNVEDLTHLLFEDVNFADGDWRKGSGVYLPEQQGPVFFGWHAESMAGYGVFVDDMTVENWGPVGLGEQSPSGIVNIYSHKKKVIINTDESWNGAEIRVMNSMGQIRYTGHHSHQTFIELNNNKTGLYIVTLQKGNKVETRKLIIR